MTNWRAFTLDVRLANFGNLIHFILDHDPSVLLQLLQMVVLGLQVLHLAVHHVPVARQILHFDLLLALLVYAIFD